MNPRAHRSRLPFIARTLMPREVSANAMMAIALGALEGGLVGVIVKTRFDEVAEPSMVNLAVALVSGAPALANLASLTITGLAAGRDKPRVVALCMGLAALAVIGIAAAPVTLAGLILLTASMIAGRVAWAGVITLRSAIWRANFPRNVRARITGRVTVTFSVIMAISAGLIGFAMEYHADAYRLLFPLAGLFGGFAAWRYRGTRLRHAGRLARDERAGSAGTVAGRLTAPWQILIADREYRRYMLTMFIFGSGNLMVIALLVVILNEQFAVPRFQQVLITTSLPLVTVALFTPFWARFFDSGHVLHYRARHSWAFVLATGLFLVASSTGSIWMFWAGALALGAAFAGGQLGWNLGHNDFASDDRATLYMGIHVTLTGVRGLLAPLLGVLIYQMLEGIEPGLGRHVLWLPWLLCLTGALMFVYQARRLKRR